MADWQVWIDTGGTFTDCMGVNPEGETLKAKVLSNSALRGKIVELKGPDRFRIGRQWDAPDDFIKGFSLNILDLDHEPLSVTAFDSGNSLVTLSSSIESLGDLVGKSIEVVSNEEAPILACRLLTGTKPEEALPSLRMRLATTKGTNALLENKCAPTMLLTTEGFADLLLIGNQKRPDLFSKQVIKPALLYREVVEIPERIDASGDIIKSLDTSTLEEQVRPFLEIPDASIAICLMHSYKNPSHELAVKELLKKYGARHISVATELSSFIKILPRTQTTVVNASLDPVLKKYLTSVENKIGEGSLHIMTSAGGLINSHNFMPKDSLLSGPAGGVVGASTIGNNNGFERIISFDMGGTSTDVARYDKDFDYVFDHHVGNARLNAPALSIETVAAGGGSICSFDGSKLTVGPESAGAFPGPACYGAGGPLTLTDVNLLLGRLEQDNFGIPINRDQSEVQFSVILQAIGEKSKNVPGQNEILEGFLQIANERMADAIRKVSMRKGYNPSDYALVAFGGAGAQHACAIAGELDMKHILIPDDAGLLSAYGLGNAVIEHFSEQQILAKLSQAEKKLEDIFERLKSKAIQELREKEDVKGDILIRKKLVFMRLKGQDSTLEIEFVKNLEKTFEQAYKNRYGHWVEGAEIEVESARVIASTLPRQSASPSSESKKEFFAPVKKKQIQFFGQKMETPIYKRKEIPQGTPIHGPALILDPYSTIVIEPGWNAEVRPDATLQLVKTSTRDNISELNSTSTVALELFKNRFTSIAEEMGELLKRTALSVNVKERMDYSCALLNADGELVVNAPHIPVHLGALGLCVRELKKTIEMKPGDVIVTNHPAYGGSHLPDVTVITPVYANDQILLGYAASRAHHAEIGGTRPGSMPPDAASLAEEGVVISPDYLIRGGKQRWDYIRQQLTAAAHPTRSIQENMADLQAAVAANHRGAQSLRAMAHQSGSDRVAYYMDEIKREAARKCKEMLKALPDGTTSAVEYLDDGSPLKVSIEKEMDQICFDFTGTGQTHPGNLNATPAIINSVIMYVLRLLIDQPLPLNEGLLEPVTIILPKCMLNPDFPVDPSECPAVVGGNTETSQRLVDLLLKPFEQVACSQGTMNNVLFGDHTFGYYETIGGGTGAGAGFDGADAVHQHMTNTAGTDPEILEHRYPVRLDRYSIRRASGGSGRFRGGDGIERELTFLKPVSLSVLTQHRIEKPYGLKGGGSGSPGQQWVIRQDGTRQELPSIGGMELEAGDRFIIHTPGGGGFGKKTNHK